jgi:hypothetical protein
MDINEKNQLLLTQLILMFQTAALQQMGKLKNPLTDKIEKDLSQAQISIDMLEMLHKKMKGNLTQEEDRLFSSVLQELKLNYVDEAMKDQHIGTSAAPQQPLSSTSTSS